MDLPAYFQHCAQLIDQELDRQLPPAATPPQTLHEAMRHPVFAGGKRLRPILCLASCEACGADSHRALPAAAAIELMHTYSLVHDDLPAMDDDGLRRGQPTCHVVFGEATAILAGDALLTLAFAVLAKAPPTTHYSSATYITELAQAGSSHHLIGGQILDLQHEGEQTDLETLRHIHRSKTGALLTAAIRLGAMTADAPSAHLAALTRFGQALGLAFQVIDDILDATQSTQALGKTAGKDLNSNKSTYPALLGLDGAREEAAQLTEQAMQALRPLGAPAARLQEIAHHMLRRNY